MNGLSVNSFDIPKGIYKSTCGGCYVSNKVLNCKECMDLNGDTHETSINATKCKYIKNANGKLVCDDHDMLPDNEMDVPLGTYLFYCGGCKMLDKERILLCSKCKDTNYERIQNNVIMNLEHIKCLKVSFKGNKLMCSSFKPSINL